MLSVIISSYQPAYYSALETNIAETCGVEYEIIKVENPGKMGVCRAYNIGAHKAKYGNLLFVHEDTRFITANWGAILLEYLSDLRIGVVGLLGTDYIPNAPFAWWDLEENAFSNYIQYSDGAKLFERSLPTDHYVYALDGVFLAVRKDVYKEFPFNEKLEGYHGYDLDFSIRISHHFSNLVTSKIKLVHYSYAVGRLNKEWLADVTKARSFYKIPRGQKLEKKKEACSFQNYLRHMEETGSDMRNKIPLLKFLSPTKIGYKCAAQYLLRIIFKK